MNEDQLWTFYRGVEALAASLARAGQPLSSRAIRNAFVAGRSSQERVSNLALVLQELDVRRLDAERQRVVHGLRTSADALLSGA